MIDSTGFPASNTYSPRMSFHLNRWACLASHPASSLAGSEANVTEGSVPPQPETSANFASPRILRIRLPICLRDLPSGSPSGPVISSPWGASPRTKIRFSWMSVWQRLHIVARLEGFVGPTNDRYRTWCASTLQLPPHTLHE